MIQKIIISLVIITLALFTKPTSSALACSGGPSYEIDDVISASQVIVRATVIDVDDRGYSAILRVHEYYKGEGEQFIVVMRYPVGLASGASLRAYDTGCLYSGSGRPFYHGDSAYFGLRSNGDGTYNDVHGTTHFHVIDGIATNHSGAVYGEGYYLIPRVDDGIPHQEFLELVLASAGRDAPIIPPRATYHPLRRFLNITTENGTRYQINPDRSVMPLPEDAPLAISPDGSHVAFRIEEDTILFQYIDTQINYPTEHSLYQTIFMFEYNRVIGQHAQFSNNSNFVAVWNQENLKIYLINNEPFGNNGRLMHFILIADIPLSISSPDTLPARVMWSADSSSVVWLDDSGIWRWDIVREAEAMLVVSTEELTLTGSTLLDVSMYGRYVRYGNSQEWWLVDTTTATTLHNVLVTQDEQFVILPSGHPDLVPYPTCTPPLRDSCLLLFHEEAGNITLFPYHTNYMGMIQCQDDEDTCRLEFTSNHPAIYRQRPHLYPVFSRSAVQHTQQIIYDPYYHQFAVVVGDYSVQFDVFMRYQLRDYYDLLGIVDLEGILDSPIASIEWGQPIFFEYGMFTTSNYLP